MVALLVVKHGNSISSSKIRLFFFYWTIGQRLTTMAPDGNWRFDEFLDALICPSVPETRWCRTCARAPPWPPRWGTGWTGASRSTRWGSRTPACWSCVASGARPGNCKWLLLNLHLTPKSIFLKIQQILVANFYTLGNQFSTYIKGVFIEIYIPVKMSSIILNNINCSKDFWKCVEFF